MSAFSSFSFDDSSGESLGDGLDSGALDLSSADQLGEEDDLGVLGSSLTLGDADYSDSESLSVTDPLSGESDWMFSGVSDPISSGEFDTGDWDTNGAGSAASTHSSGVQSTDSMLSLFSGIAKFGSSIGQLLTRGGSPGPGYAVAHPPANLNPNRSLVSTVTSTHALLLVGAVIAIGAAIALGGKNV